MTRQQAKAEADELIARANRIAKAKLDAAGEKRVKAKDATTQRMDRLRALKRQAIENNQKIQQEYAKS